MTLSEKKAYLKGAIEIAEKFKATVKQSKGQMDAELAVVSLEFIIDDLYNKAQQLMIEQDKI